MKLPVPPPIVTIFFIRSPRKVLFRKGRECSRKFPLEKTRFPQETLFVGALGIEPRLNDPKSLVLPLYYAPRYLIELDLKTNQEFRLFPLYPFQTYPSTWRDVRKKQPRPDGIGTGQLYLLYLENTEDYLTASFKVFPAVNFGTVIAGMVILAFVCGLIPSRAARFETLNVPKPVRVTLFPLRS